MAKTSSTVPVAHLCTSRIIINSHNGSFAAKSNSSSVANGPLTDIQFNLDRVGGNAETTLTRKSQSLRKRKEGRRNKLASHNWIERIIGMVIGR